MTKETPENQANLKIETTTRKLQKLKERVAEGVKNGDEIGWGADPFALDPENLDIQVMSKVSELQARLPEWTEAFGLADVFQRVDQHCERVLNLESPYHDVSKMQVEPWKFDPSEIPNPFPPIVAEPSPNVPKFWTRVRDNLAALTRLLGQVPAQSPGSRTKAGKKARRKDETLVNLRILVKKLRQEDLTYQEICCRLGDQPRPSRCAWRDLTWPNAYMQHSNAVTKWLSQAAKDA